MEKPRIKILLIEDDKIDQLAFKRLVKSAQLPYDYTIAGSTAEARKFLDSNQFDVVITDYSLGDGTGFDIFPHVQNAPIIFVTGGGDEEIAIKAMREGAFDYLIKDQDCHYLKVLPVTIKNAVHHNQTDERITLLSHAVMSINDSVVILDMDGRANFVNKAFCETYGYAENDILNQYLDFIWDDPSDFKKFLNISDDFCHNQELNHRRKDGQSFPVSLSRSFIQNNRGTTTAIVGVVRDITQQKKAELECNQAKEAAEMANSAKSEFLANMSHEIRTPLNGIIGMTDLTLETSLDATQVDFLEAVKYSADSLLALVNDILDFSKIEAGKLEIENIYFSLSELITRTLNGINVKAIEKELPLKYKIESNVPDGLMGDPTRLKQIITNLIGNAIKFTDQGEVILKVWPESHKDMETVLHFAVIDTGVGIPKEKHETIFEVFTQADGTTTRKYGGTGLGLAITSRLVSLLDGEIWVESPVKKPMTSSGNPGSGFHFTVRFEVLETEEKQKETDPISATVTHSSPQVERSDNLNPLKVLVADDNIINVKLVEALLHKKGCDVETVGDGKAAVSAFEKSNYDLVLMDVQMPEMDGLEATRTIRGKEKQTGQHTPIIALTAHAMRSDMDRCIHAGMDDYVSKPMKARELFETIARLIPGRLDN